ncbi:MAG: ClpXP protease specificity-enhancing factor [Kangiellaceae bacterium]|nr:ClpXP protease specificity-enhancing factor [Kangiellaceae bacterium]
MGSSFSSNKPYLFRAIYEWILDNEGTPFLLVDANQPNVQIPFEHVKDGQIILNASPSAIQNWFADNDAISFNTRFSGKPLQIYIPISALLAIYAQENSLGMAFPEAVEQSNHPLEDEKDSQVQSKDNEKSKKKSKVSHLKVIK